MVNLGDKVKDTVSGFVGVAVSRHSYLNGCDRVSVQPAANNKTGKLEGSQTFDEPQLKVLKKQGFLQGLRLTGGPAKYMDEGR